MNDSLLHIFKLSVPRFWPIKQWNQFLCDCLVIKSIRQCGGNWIPVDTCSVKVETYAPHLVSYLVITSFCQWLRSRPVG